MAISLPDARELSNEVISALRLRALRARELGFSELDIAMMLGLTRETVSRWWSAYCSEGLQALPGDRTGRPVGSGRTLSDEQAAHLQHLIDNNRPEDLGIASPLWSRAAIGELIRQQFGIDMPVRTVGEYLKRWGYTAKKPRRHAKDQDPVEVKRWLQETYPSLARKARKEGAVILWCDEVGILADTYAGVGYARKGEASTMEVPKPHIRVNMISAISNEGLVRFMTYKQSLNGALFIVFLSQLIRGTSGKIYLIVDRLRAHHSREVEAWLAEHKGRIEVVPLPKSSPEMNADEYLNNDMKGNVKAKGLPDTRVDLLGKVESFMRKLRRIPEHVANYFQNPYVQYAAAT